MFGLDIEEVESGQFIEVRPEELTDLEGRLVNIAKEVVGVKALTTIKGYYNPMQQLLKSIWQVKYQEQEQEQRQQQQQQQQLNQQTPQQQQQQLQQQQRLQSRTRSCMITVAAFTAHIREMESAGALRRRQAFPIVLGGADEPFDWLGAEDQGDELQQALSIDELHEVQCLRRAQGSLSLTSNITDGMLSLANWSKKLSAATWGASKQKVLLYGGEVGECGPDVTARGAN